MGRSREELDPAESWKSYLKPFLCSFGRHFVFWRIVSAATRKLAPPGGSAMPPLPACGWLLAGWFLASRILVALSFFPLLSLSAWDKAGHRRRGLERSVLLHHYMDCSYSYENVIVPGKRLSLGMLCTVAQHCPIETAQMTCIILHALVARLKKGIIILAQYLISSIWF